MAIESVGESVISQIAESLVEPAIRQFRYMFCFNSFVEEFNEQKQSLTFAQDRLQSAVNVAERNAEEIEKDVEKWLKDAKKEVEDMKPLEDRIGKNGKSSTWCPNWIRCPNWMRQFKLSKELAEKTETLRKLNSKNFPTVSHKAPPQPIEFLPSTDFTPSESSNEAFKLIMEALKDDNVKMIGLYGMGGVGKTTLVKEVGRRGKELQLFDQVLMAVVSQNPIVTNIQDQMADSLGLDIKEKSAKGRADRVWQRLQKERTVLIILDDVWEDIDLRDIGIPLGDDHKGCKILLTTRLKDICSSMGCQRTVFLRILSESEAWGLFKTNAGIGDEDSSLNKVAKEVARECQGLPIALVTVGRALKGKSLFEWKAASQQLKNPQLHLEQIDKGRNAYACLKFSYGYLRHEGTKSCFLLCCLFPEDHNIPIESLTRYAVGLGLYKDAESIEDTRIQVYAAAESLKGSCMLLDGSSKQYVKMHDLVRDVAIKIASSKEYGFMTTPGIGLKKWPWSNESFEDCTMISLMGNRLTELPEGLVCPKLKVLLLELDDNAMVPYGFFEGMKAIEVLTVKGGCSLSCQSLEFSTNLQFLELIFFDKCEDLISLSKLQRLKILVLWIGSIYELPAEIGELKELRILDLRYCIGLRMIPANLMRRLNKLEELYMNRNQKFDIWDVGGNASLTELNSLSHLAVSVLSIPEVKRIPRDFVFPKLNKYEIRLGGRNWCPILTSNVIIFDGISAVSLNMNTFKLLFPTVSQIYLENVQGLKNIIMSSSDQILEHEQQQQGYLQELVFLRVRHCRDIRTLFPAMLVGALENLRSVETDQCDELEEVFELQGLGTKHPHSSCFPNLLEIQISHCRKLKYVFPVTIVTGLLQLQKLKVHYADQLMEVFRQDIKASSADVKIAKEIKVPKLLELSLQGLPNLDYLGTATCDFIFPSLETLTVEKCPKMITMFSPESKGSILNLRNLSIQECERVQEVGSFVTNRRDGHEVAFPSLEVLKLSCLPGLMRCIYKGLILKNLTTLEVTDCNRLSHILPSSLIANLLQLKVLNISRCESLGQIIATDDYKANSPANVEKEIEVPDLLKLSLKDLPSIVCFSLECQNFLFPRLKKCVVGNCPKMATKFSVTQNGSMSARSEVCRLAEDSSNSRAMLSSSYKMWTRDGPDGGWSEKESSYCWFLAHFYPTLDRSG